MKMIKILGTLILLIFASACNAATEPNDYAYILAIGVDKAETDDQYEISVQFAKPAQISGGSSEEGGTGGETLGLVTVEAPDIYAGINFANNLVSKKFQFSHTKIIVISEELAKEGIGSVIYTIERSNDLRPNMYIAVSKGKAREYLAEVKPEMEINPVKYYQLIFDNDYAEFVPKNASQHTYFYMDSKERDIILPLVAKSKQDKDKGETKSAQGNSSGGGDSGGKDGGGTEEEEPKELPKSTQPVNYGGFEYQLREYIAGDITEYKKNKTEAMGMAIFSGEKMIGEMNGLEGEIYNMVDGNFQYSYNTFFAKNSQKPIVMQMKHYKKPKINVEIENGKPKIGIKLIFEGNIVSALNDYFVEGDIKNYENELEGYIEEAVLKFLNKTSKEFGADILGFGSYAKKSFLDVGEFEEFDWQKAYKEAEFEADIDVRIVRTGAVIKNIEGQ